MSEVNYWSVEKENVPINLGVLKEVSDPRMRVKILYCESNVPYSQAGFKSEKTKKRWSSANTDLGDHIVEKKIVEFELNAALLAPLKETQ
ncbi:jg27772 [Pararge aegeria aegeria]|uniref:Jg27772 protein n=1 Tax=Pararge aegeria aegeria TaxID=348720 RepID=A0A8S4S1Q2_9NEOP|nr:jg27772 [Pararge aegeria aegeria]